jgi:hypothetical protein
MAEAGRGKLTLVEKRVFRARWPMTVRHDRIMSGRGRCGVRRETAW